MKKTIRTICIVAMLPMLFFMCQSSKETVATKEDKRLPVIIDTDANNELDDQHALAYLFFNQDFFRVLGVTVNATYNGGDIETQYAEAERIMKLCKADTLPLLRGANRNFSEIESSIKQSSFDGVDAVDFIIKNARSATAKKLTIIAVGKLTTVALALKKDPSIADHVRLVWLGSNYPDPGEYNQDNDTISMNYILNNTVEFEIATVRYGKPSGTAAVKLTKQEALEKMPGRGGRISKPITGRHGGEFYSFGDYSVNLFEHINYDGTPPARALFDMAAVAIVKNPDWAAVKTIPAPVLVGNKWIERPANKRKIKVWENFKPEEILKDFFETIPVQ